MTAKAAIDSMFTQFNTAWQSNAAAICGYAPEIRWQGVKESSIPDGSKYWCRVSEQTVMEQAHAIGNKLYESSGLVYVQIFAPQTDAQGFNNCRELANLARDAFRAQNALVSFKNSRATQVADEKGFYRFNTVVEYDYTELRG
jgi:hypothetical protein